MLHFMSMRFAQKLKKLSYKRRNESRVRRFVIFFFCTSKGIAVRVYCLQTAYPASTFRSGSGTAIYIYAHLDYGSKITSAQAMETGPALPESGNFGSRWEDGEVPI